MSLQRPISSLVLSQLSTFSSCCFIFTVNDNKLLTCRGWWVVVELIDFKKIKNRNISCSELGSRCPSSLQYPHVLSSSFDYTLYCQDLKRI